MSYKLPLATINHSLIDRIKLASFFLDPRNRWSMGEKTKQVEEYLSKESGYKHCVATSSGSTANTLLAMRLAETTKRKKIVVPSITWSTSITPFILAGFEPIFVDVEEARPVMCHRNLLKALKDNRGSIAAVIHTTLLGISNESLSLIQTVCDSEKVELIVDSCEDTIGIFSYGKIKEGTPQLVLPKSQTTSFYLAHEYQACAEMGALFTDSQQEYEYFLCARNHGMIRHVENGFYYKKNPLVDSRFDFPVIGNNFRPNEISAYALSLDLKIHKDRQNHGHFRLGIAQDFYSNLSKIYNYLEDHLFALPIVIRQEYGGGQAKYFIDKIKTFAEELGIETRPIVGGNLLRQTIFQKYGDYKGYPNAEWFHKYGIYVGLYKKMNRKILMKFRDKIDTL